MNNRMDKELATNILHWLGYDYAEITDIYYNSFRAKCKNQYRLFEINVELNCYNEIITEENVYRYVVYVIHTIEWYY